MFDEVLAEKMCMTECITKDCCTDPRLSSFGYKMGQKMELKEKLNQCKEREKEKDFSYL